MRALLMIIVLALAVVGAAALIDYTGVADVPMIDVIEQADES